MKEHRIVLLGCKRESCISPLYLHVLIPKPMSMILEANSSEHCRSEILLFSVYWELIFCSQPHRRPNEDSLKLNSQC